MANMNVKARLLKIDKELRAVAHHVSLYGGIDKKDALMIDNAAAQLAILGASLCADARDVMGDKSAKKTVPAVRKALGFIY